LSPEYFGVDDLYFSLHVIRIGGACGTYEKEEKWVESVGGKSVTEGSNGNRRRNMQMCFEESGRRE
jgi:hypothetical protein